MLRLVPPHQTLNLLTTKSHIGCDTCRRRKVSQPPCRFHLIRPHVAQCKANNMQVKCDGRAGVCERCEKLGLQCLRDGEPRVSISPFHPQLERASNQLAQQPGLQSGSSVLPDGQDSDLTQAGHKRLRTTAACVRCRTKKLKCDAQKPACTLCSKKGHQCEYISTKRRGSKLLPGGSLSTDRRQFAPQTDESYGRASNGPSSVSPPQHEVDAEMRDGPGLDTPSQANSARPNEATGSQSTRHVPQGSLSGTSQDPGETPDSQHREPYEPPSGRYVLPYLDSFLENIHPISCNNFLHPGSLCAGIDRAPPLLLLAICGSSAKFMPGDNSRQKGSIWIDEAKSIIMRNMGGSSTLTISAIQFLALHEMHNGNYTSAWNLVGESALVVDWQKLKQQRCSDLMQELPFA